MSLQNYPLLNHFAKKHEELKLNRILRKCSVSGRMTANRNLMESDVNYLALQARMGKIKVLMDDLWLFDDIVIFEAVK